MAISSGDTAWVLASAALVMIMTPALGYFYGGMAGRKNILSLIGQSFAVLTIVSIQWVLVGFSIAFAPGPSGVLQGIVGGTQYIGMANMGYSATYPGIQNISISTFMIFQAMFAVITPALVSGAFVGRMKFSTFIVFTLAWTTLVYDPVAHWVWAYDGWLHGMGILDFAGGTVVHLNAGVAGLAAALFIGPRLTKSDGTAHAEPTLTILGAALLWFGWFGFNAGSALGASALAVNAFIVTNTAAALASLTWLGLSWHYTGKASMLGAASGAVAGLVAITPASGFVNIWGALAVGFGAGAICFYAVAWRNRTKVDDTLDTFGVHGVGGAWGAIATGLFATVAVNSGGANGLFYGNPGQVEVQLIAVAASSAYSFLMTIGILKVLDYVMGVRVPVEEEHTGLDIAHHGERGYTGIDSHTITEMGVRLTLTLQPQEGKGSGVRDSVNLMVMMNRDEIEELKKLTGGVNGAVIGSRQLTGKISGAEGIED